MQPFAFSPTAVFDAYRHRVCRAAVLTPVLGAAWHAGGLEAAMEALRRRWHKLVDALCAAGLDRLRSPGAALRMKNCPPTGVQTGQFATRCKWAAVCPYCYAREYVLEAFCRAERALWGGPRGRRLAPGVGPGDHVLLFSLTRWLSPRGRRFTPAEKADVVAFAREIVAGDRAREVDWVRPRGAFVLHTLDVRPGGWPLRRSGVMLCAGEPPDWPESWRRERKEDRGSWRGGAPWSESRPAGRVDREWLFRGMAANFGYPAGLLDAEPEDLAVRHGGLRRVRMAAGYGVMHKPARAGT